jgi:hypothetical protein
MRRLARRTALVMSVVAVVFSATAAAQVPTPPSPKAVCGLIRAQEASRVMSMDQGEPAQGVRVVLPSTQGGMFRYCQIDYIFERSQFCRRPPCYELALTFGVARRFLIGGRVAPPTDYEIWRSKYGSDRRYVVKKPVGLGPKAFVAIPAAHKSSYVEVFVARGELLLHVDVRRPLAGREATSQQHAAVAVKLARIAYRRLGQLS